VNQSVFFPLLELARVSIVRRRRGFTDARRVSGVSAERLDHDPFRHCSPRALSTTSKTSVDDSLVQPTWKPCALSEGGPGKAYDPDWPGVSHSFSDQHWRLDVEGSLISPRLMVGSCQQSSRTCPPKDVFTYWSWVISRQICRIDWIEMIGYIFVLHNVGSFSVQ
jgi:hypothetical protein